MVWHTAPMPELPEVETIRRQLAPRLLDRRVTAAWGFDSPKFASAPLASGCSFGRLRRRGKYLLVPLHGSDSTALSNSEEPRSGAASELVVHLGMTGQLLVLDGDAGDDHRPQHLRARFDLDDGSYLGFWDARRFGRAMVVPVGAYSGLPTLAHLGPEPFSEEFNPVGLRSALSGRKAIKTALMDQRVVAGVGNIYADEALWQSEIRPTVRRLGPGRAELLHRAVVDVLSRAVDDGGTTLRDYRDASGSQGTHQNQLRCYGRSGLPCLRCGEPLARSVIDGRGTTWCRRCQT